LKDAATEAEAFQPQREISLSPFRFMIPTQILAIWLTGLLSLGVVAGIAHFFHEWYRRSWGYDQAVQQSVFAPVFGWNEPTLFLAAAVLLFAVALAGRTLVRWLLRLTTGGRNARADTNEPAPRHTREGEPQLQRLQRADGSELQVEIHGRRDAPTIVLTHGWGLNSTAWYYAKRELGRHFRLIVWDQPGLGKSTRPSNRDFSLEKLAGDLHAVLGVAGDGPVTLLGHSIGGMITLTFCRMFPEELGRRVSGLVLTHTTYTNPVRTVKGAPFFTAIETPVLKPLMYLTIALSPLVWLMNWMSYLNGSSHLTTKRTSFGGAETWDQIDFAALFQAKASPAVLARGMLGMMRYDATDTLRGVDVPALIIAGEIDPVCKPEASERMRADIPHSELRTLPLARHLGFIEHHETFADLVGEFARSANTSARTPAMA
jgi:pimeloyl-ACP methyl ester carboxylesterase